MSSSLDVKHFSNEVSTIVKWKIENFTTQLPKDTKTELDSPSFYLYKSRLEFYLEFESISEDDEHKNWSSVYLMPDNLDNEKEVELKLKFWIENESGEKIGSQREMNRKFEQLNSGWGKTNFAKHLELYPPESAFIKNDIVFICCEIVQNSSQKIFKPIPLNDVKVLRHYYKPKKYGGKLTIQMKNKTFKVKKSLLTLRSSVFEQMLGNKNFCENKNNTMKIEDFEPEVMEAFVDFVHLEFLTQENAEHAHDLLKLADKYNVVKLKEECSQILSKTLDKDNVFSILITSFMHDCSELKENVLEYLSRDDSDTNFNTIMKTKEWREFMVENEEVSNEIIDAINMKGKSSKKNESEAGPSTSKE